MNRNIQHIVLIFSFLLISPIIVSVSYSQNYTEYEVKAAYIFNFAKFVQWPTDSFQDDNSPLILGIYGDDPFGTILHNTFSKTVNGRSWVIKHLQNVNDIGKCHILFISGISKFELSQVLEYTNKKPILTIGNNIPDFCFNGGIVNFTPQFSKHQFEINNDIAIQSSLTISSKLLILARIIRTNEVKF